MISLRGHGVHNVSYCLSVAVGDGGGHGGMYIQYLRGSSIIYGPGSKKEINRNIKFRVPISIG